MIRFLLALLWVPGAIGMAEGTVAAVEDVGSSEAEGRRAAEAMAIDVDSMAILVTPDHPREFIYTDKSAAHLAGEAVGADTRSYHGFYVAMHELLDGWSLRLEDGTELGAATAEQAEVFPDRLVRRHRLPDGAGVTETVTLFDHANGLRVLYEQVPAGSFEFVPRVDMRFLWRVGKPAYRVEWLENILRLAREDEVASAARLDHPAWLAVAVTGAEEFREDGRYLDRTYPKDAARQAMAQASPFLVGSLAGRIPPRIHEGSIEIVIAADQSSEAAAARARLLRAESDARALARRERMTRLIEASRIATGIARDDRALAWARISLDNLIMEQRGPGIYAGFYWFTTYWGRDSFIALPGACLVQGDFETARAILTSFAAFQERDPASPREGRLPNFVTVEQVQFAGIDGTWWFVRALDELWRRSGDDTFAREMTPVVVRAVEGALRHAVDDEGFLTHGDGETWMDAGGEAHPYSPRGNRAVEVQALFHHGLRVAARLAERFGEEALAARAVGLDQGRQPAVDREAARDNARITSGAELAGHYRRHAETLARSFHASFFWWDAAVVPGDSLLQLADHINRDGSPDGQVRPNGLLAVLASPELFTLAQRQFICEQAARYVVMPWGVRSLAGYDRAYHPRHLNLARYYYDEAYHNGDVWLWLSGPFVSALPDPRDGFGQTRMLMDEILDEGAVGTLQEIRDGDRAASNDEFGGATSQAWSLSELLRQVSDDYLGLVVDLTANPPRVDVLPYLPPAWPQLRARTRIGDYGCEVICRQPASRVPDSTSPESGGASGAGEVILRFDRPIPEDWVVALGWQGKVLVENANCAEARQETERTGAFDLRLGELPSR